MPYVSEAQRGKFHAMEERGEISPETVKEWDKASKGKKLPKRVKKAAELGFALGYAASASSAEKSAAFGADVGRFLQGMGTRVQGASAGFGKHIGVDPLAWMKTPNAATNAYRAKMLGGITAASAGYGAYRLLGGGQQQQPAQPRYVQPTPYYPMGY